MNPIMGDSANPPAAYPKVDAWAFYVHGDTPHVWTDEEVAAIPCRYRLPILTRNIGGDPAKDAAALIAWCRAHGQPAGTLTALDFEDRVDPIYLRAYDTAVHAAGWLVAVYGQQSTVLGNPRPSGGYWVANWDRDAAATRLASGWAARQYAGDTQLGHPWDLSVVAADTPLWDTRGADMPLTQQDIAAVAAAVYNYGREDVTFPDGSTGHNVPLGQLAHGAWVATNDGKTGTAALASALANLNKTVAALSSPPAVDVAALAAALASTLGPALETAAAQGVQLTADQFAVTLEQHLGAALSAAAKN